MKMYTSDVRLSGMRRKDGRQTKNKSFRDFAERLRLCKADKEKFIQEIRPRDTIWAQATKELYES